MRSTISLFLCGLALAILSSCHLIRSSAPNASLNVMTFNVRYNNPNDGENAWPLRQTRFALLQQGTFWLSTTPEQPGSVGWDAALTRVCTWGKFKDRDTRKIFFLFNTHFDHMGEKARIESAKLIREKIQTLAPTEPIIVTGDFNANPNSLVYQTMTTGTPENEKQNNHLLDTRAISQLPHYGPRWTFHGFGAATERPLIDYIFVNHRAIVRRHGTIAESIDGRYASDHLPVLAELVWK